MNDQYKKSVTKIVSRIFRAAGDLDLRTLSERSGVSHSTVWKLANGWTLYPYYRTIFKLAAVVGLKIKLVASTRRKTHV